MNTASIEFPGILLKDGVFIVFLTTTYVAIGYLVSIAPQSIAQSEIVSRIDSSTSVSGKNALNDDIPFGTDDLERPPKYMEFPGNANHFDLLF